MFYRLLIFVSISISLINRTFGEDLYPSYTISIDPKKVLEWSNDRALSYVTTVRLFDYDHHIFQYKRYLCQYFYTDEIQIHYENESIQQCIYNETTVDYEYRFQLHLDSRHVEPFILKNLAINCIYVNCSFSQLDIKYLQIDWNTEGQTKNAECTFDTNQPYAIQTTPYTISEWIKIRCKSLDACRDAKKNLEQTFTSNVRITYGSSYELQQPYCSLEKSLSHVIEKKLDETNGFLHDLVALIQRGFAPPDEREQTKLREYVEQISSMSDTTTTTPMTTSLKKKRNPFRLS